MFRKCLTNYSMFHRFCYV